MAAASVVALFDIDGTLVESPSIIHARAIEHAVDEVYGCKLSVPEAGADALNGLTTPMLARVVLRDAGLREADIDARWDRWRQAMVDCYVQLQSCLPEQRPFGDTVGTLRSLIGQGVQVGLLTGNFRAVADAKLRRAGAWVDGIDLNQGAFGDDADERDELGRAARARADDAGAGHVVVVGDTPRDIACARAADAYAIALTSGGFPRAELHAADAVLDTLTEAAEEILGLR
jgi:phosphoglycolate phosphatase-like HAD superfamily hydrolase